MKCKKRQPNNSHFRFWLGVLQPAGSPGLRDVLSRKFERNRNKQIRKANFGNVQIDKQANKQINIRWVGAWRLFREVL